MTDVYTVTIKSIIDGYRVRCGDTNEVVNGVLISGCKMDILYNGEVDIECTEWSIEGEYDPHLLIEAAEWYDLPPEEDESR